LSLLLGILVGNTSWAAEKESVYDRVMRTGVVRIGYALNPPILMKDPNTGALSGIFYESVNQLFTELQLKPVWTEEMGWGQFPEALQAGRCDVVACGAWVSPGRARVVDFSIPLFYSPMGVWVRNDDHRFDGAISKIDDPGVTIAALEGEMSSIIAQSRFPRAKTLMIPQLSDLSMNLLNVEAKKADVTFVERAIAVDYLKHHPGKLRDLAATKPFRVFGNGLMFKRGEGEFKSMINLMIDQQLRFGTIDDLLKKYEPAPGVYYRVAPPYLKD
jgi:polar amino acid transport system substrate-binding protein